MFDCIFSNPLFEALGIWLLLTGIIGFFAMGIDKARAIQEEWRISERTLFVMTLVGGFWGVILSGEIFHHKTSKLSFLIPVYAVAALWVFLLFRLGFVGCLVSSVTHL